MKKKSPAQLNKKKRNDIIIVGRFGRAHGVNGMIKVFSYTEPRNNILQYQPWLVNRDGTWSSINYNQAQQHNKFFVVSIDGMGDRSQSETLTNCDIAVYRNQLPELVDEYYWTDLEGLTVINLQGVVLGYISHLIATGSNDVLVVKGEYKTHMIPYLFDDYIKDINLSDATVYVDWDPEF